MSDREQRRVAEREVPLRVFDEAMGTEWRVREISARGVPGAPGDRCLLFESAGVIRRVWNYPRDWQRLPLDELLELSWRSPRGGGSTRQGRGADGHAARSFERVADFRLERGSER